MSFKTRSVTLCSKFPKSNSSMEMPIYLLQIFVHRLKTFTHLLESAIALWPFDALVLVPKLCCNLYNPLQQAPWPSIVPMACFY